MSNPRFVLVRHGETDWNAQSRWQGSSDVPLNPVGLAQARAAASWYAQMDPVAIWSSPLDRALTTAREVAELVGRDVTVDARLAEMDFGDHEGRTWQEIEAAEPELDAFRQGEKDLRWSAKGETGAEVSARMVEVLTHIDENTKPEGLILVACHGTAIRHGVGGMMGWDFPTLWHLGSVDNCHYTTLVREFDSWRVEQYNAAPQWNFAG